MSMMETDNQVLQQKSVLSEKHTEPVTPISADCNKGLQKRSMSNTDATNITNERRCSTREKRSPKRLIVEV